MTTDVQQKLMDKRSEMLSSRLKSAGFFSSNDIVTKLGTIDVKSAGVGNITDNLTISGINGNVPFSTGISESISSNTNIGILSGQTVSDITNGTVTSVAQNANTILTEKNNTTNKQKWQFDRIYKLTVGFQDGTGVIFEGKPRSTGLDINFEIVKDSTSKTNKSKITLYNIRNENIAVMCQKDVFAILEVGYSQNEGLKRIFEGFITSCKTKFGVDVETEIELADGALAVRDCVVSVAYTEGVSRRQIIEDVAMEMGLTIDIAEDCEFSLIPNGYSFVGAGKNLLDKTCAACGLKWYIQNGILQVCKEGGNMRRKGYSLNVNTGLIGSPERIIKEAKQSDKTNSKTSQETVNTDNNTNDDNQEETENSEETTKKKKTATVTKNEKEEKNSGKQSQKAQKKAGWKVTCLLNPALNVGDLIYIKSRQMDSWYQIESLKHNGDYSGQNWYSELEVFEPETAVEARKEKEEKEKQEKEEKEKKQQAETKAKDNQKKTDKVAKESQAKSTNTTKDSKTT